jgi:hypothetical protein
VAGVDEPVEQGLGDDGVGKQWIPVGRGPVGGEDRRPAGAFGDQLVEVVGLGVGEGADAEVIELCGPRHSASYVDVATMPRIVVGWPGGSSCAAACALVAG